MCRRHCEGFIEFISLQWSIGLSCVQGLYYSRQSRPNEAVPGPPEGCALLTRNERLTLLASRTVR